MEEISSLVEKDNPPKTETQTRPVEFSEDTKQNLSEDDIEKILKNAAAGCAVAQLQAGRHYLQLSCVQGPEDSTTTAKHGVTWLCKASRQGNEEATQHLREALEKGTGVTEENLADVKWCIETSSLEKSARQAAKGLFQAINPLSPNTTVLESLNKHERKLIEKALKAGKNGDVDENQFVEKIMKRMHGSGGLTLDALLQSNVEMEAFNSASWFVKATRYPGKMLSVLADRTVDAVGKQGMSWLTRLIPTNQIYMVIAFFIYSLITLDLILWFIPLMCFYASYASMAVSTMQMFYTRRKKKDVSTIAKLLSRFNDALDNDSAESAYDWEKLTPYLTYFVSLGIMVGSFAVSDKSWIPCSELVCVSGFFCVTCFYALSDAHDHLALLSIGLDFVTTLPTVIEVIPNIPVVKSLCVLVAGNAYSVSIFPGLSLNFGIPSVAYLIVPMIFIKMAIQKSWQGWYRILIPHLVCFFWWKVTVLLFRYCTWLGLIRASVGWSCFIILLPVVGFVALISGLYYFLQVMTFGNFVKVIVTLMLLSLPILLAVWTKRGANFASFSLKDIPWLKKFILVAVFVLMFSATFLLPPIEKDVDGRFITWDEYRRFCSQPQWDKSNMAVAQMQCSHLKHSVVQWEGKVKKIIVKETNNQAEEFLKYLPLSISDWAKCVYGEVYSDCDVISDTDDRDLCTLIKLQGHRTCHLKNLDIYKFELTIQMPIDDENMVDVRVEASNWFKESLMYISEGDVVTIRAALKNNLGNIWPELSLYHVRCESRGIEYGSDTSLSETSWRVAQYVRKGASTMWNFFLAPLVQYQ